MNKPGRIVCAVDLSWRSEGAFNYAVALAKSRHAPLDLLFAISRRRQSSWRARERVAQLAELRRRAAAAGVDITVTVQHGTPSDVILQHATSSTTRPPQLIVLGAPARRGLNRFRRRSVAQAVVHQASCPTVVVPGSAFAAVTVDGLVHRVLCAIDFSPASMAALDQALRMLRRDGGTMHLLHVVDIVRAAVPRLSSEFSAFDYTGLLRQDAQRRLRMLTRSPGLDGRVQTRVAVGLVIDEILKSATAFKADLVVVGVRKRGSLARLFGSTTGRVLRRAECPVLAIPVRDRATGAEADLCAIAA
jgi:nucleotide-binding universal stress UspA family protein